MRIQFDTLKYARLLSEKGVKSCDAEGFMSTLTEIEIFNIFSKHEVNSMLSEAIEKVFVKQDEKLAENKIAKAAVAVIILIFFIIICFVFILMRDLTKGLIKIKK